MGSIYPTFHQSIPLINTLNPWGPPNDPSNPIQTTIPPECHRSHAFYTKLNGTDHWIETNKKKEKKVHPNDPILADQNFITFALMNWDRQNFSKNK